MCLRPSIAGQINCMMQVCTFPREHDSRVSHLGPRDVNFWIPSFEFWALTRPKRLVSSNDEDPPKRELLAWRRCRNSTFWTRSLFTKENRGFVSQEGRGMPLPTCDTKPEVHAMQIVPLQSRGLVSQAGRGMPVPVGNTNTRFCVAPGHCFFIDFDEDF